MRKPTHLVLASLALAFGCTSVPDVDCTQFTGRYFPMATGKSWTYRTTDQNGVRDKTQTVGPLEDVGGEKAGTTAFRLTTDKPGGVVISWQEDTGERILRHREQDMAGLTMTEEYYVENRVRLDETPAHIVDGATWQETFNEITIDPNAVPPAPMRIEVVKTWDWTVEAVDEVVQVPAGDYCALVVSRRARIGATVTSNKKFWFTRGIGKVKESADNGQQVEELVSAR